MSDTGTHKLFIEDRGDFLLVAVADAFEHPLRILSIETIPTADPELAASRLKKCAGLTRGNFAQSVIGLNPSDLFIRPVLLESASRAKSAGFVDKTLSGELSIDPSDKLTAVLHPATGELYDPAGIPSKLLLFAGAGEVTLRQRQLRLTEMGLYPSRLELCALAALGLAVAESRRMERTGPELAVCFGEKTSHAWVLSAEGVQSYRELHKGFADMYPVVQQELGLRDAQSAKRMLAAKTFDLQNIGPLLINDIVSEFLTMIGFYEVQYGQTIDRLIPVGIPESFSWMARAVAHGLGMELFGTDLRGILKGRGVEIDRGVKLGADEFAYLNLLSLAANLSPTEPN